MSFIESLQSLFGKGGSLSQKRANQKKFQRLRSNYLGQRCFVMGNGPSLNETPLEKLEGEFVWGVNRCHLLYDRISWRPKFYCAVDHRVTPSISPEIEAQSLELSGTTFFMPEQYAGLRDWEDRKNIVWTREKLQDPSLGADGYFATNPPDFLRTPNTVTITCIQLAVFMGFNPIYLIGCDAKWVMPEGLASGEGEVTDPGTGELITNFALTMESDSDPNHFHPDYFNKGDPWTAPNVGGQLFGYSKVKEKCDSLGVEIVNATVGGELEVFPRININELLDDLANGSNYLA
ncbi:MAG: DUF115 domain-containing protein [Opitutales bacterium]|jgi:hypothetical protein|nr:DUF115 domain-containing protein [Opitutales bacterium]